MRKLFLLFTAFTLHFFSFSQSRTVKVDYQKQSRTGIENDVPFPVKTVEKALEDTFTKMGYKSTSSKGFTVYKGVRMQELGPDAYDLYFMVDKKSRKDNENSVITMMVSKGFDAFISESTDEKIFANSKTYLDSLRNMLASFDLEQQIEAQQEAVKSAEKKNLGLADDAKDLEKKKRKLDEQIADNIKDQEKQVKELEKQRQILEVMKGKRKS
jgi:hypothetical protein